MLGWQTPRGILMTEISMTNVVHQMFAIDLSIKASSEDEQHIIACDMVSMESSSQFDL